MTGDPELRLRHWHRLSWLLLLAAGGVLPWHAALGQAVSGHTVPAQTIPGQAVPRATIPGQEDAPHNSQHASALRLRILLADGREREFTRSELEGLPAQSAAARLRDGAPFSVSGVSVTALLRAAGLDLSANLGGGHVVGHALIARAADGYRAVFGLAELDPHFGHPPVLVTWTNADGSALPLRVGPLQLIATGESRPGRWVRQLTSLEVKALP